MLVLVAEEDTDNGGLTYSGSLALSEVKSCHAVLTNQVEST